MITLIGLIRVYRGLQGLGLTGLGQGTGFERLHYLLERAFDGDELSYAFKKVGILPDPGFRVWVGGFYDILAEFLQRFDRVWAVSPCLLHGINPAQSRRIPVFSHIAVFALLFWFICHGKWKGI